MSNPPADHRSTQDDLAAALAAVADAAAQGPDVLARLAKALAATNGVGDAHGAPALCENLKVDDDADGVSHSRFTYRQKDQDMPRYFGPYPHRQSWRLVVRHDGNQRIQGTYATEDEAKRALRKLRAEAAKQAGITVAKAIATYGDQLRTRGLKDRSIATTRYRLLRFFKPVLPTPFPMLTPALTRSLFVAFTGSVDSRLNTLAEAKTFCVRAKANGWTDLDLLTGVRGEGRRNFGKKKLSVDESRKLVTVCLVMAGSSDPKKRLAAIAVLMALLFGMRASEITGLLVRDLDGGGTIVRINRSKTRAGIRALQVPEWLRPYLLQLAQNKQPTDLLVGKERTWLHRNVRAMCRKAGVTEVPPHGLRGTHADLALMASATPQAVSQALGHESLTTTYRHYADQGITEQHDHERAVQSLAPATTTTLN